jgi:hypothetical protein
MGDGLYAPIPAIRPSGTVGSKPVQQRSLKPPHPTALDDDI